MAIEKIYLLCISQRVGKFRNAISRVKRVHTDTHTHMLECRRRRKKKILLPKANSYVRR